MKKLIATLIVAGCSHAAMAQDTAGIPVIPVMGNSSPLTQLCFAVAESGDALEAARISELNQRLLNDVRCNNRTLSDFSRYYQNLQSRSYKTVSLKARDSSPETRLCLAALKSETDFEEARSEFPAFERIGESVRCNNMSLGQFKNRYQSHRLTAAL